MYSVYKNTDNDEIKNNLSDKKYELILNNDTQHNKTKKKPKSKIYCGNCGKCGHMYKHCHDPITSYGVIFVYINANNKDAKFINDNLIQSYIKEKNTDSNSPKSDTDSPDSNGKQDNDRLYTNVKGIKYQDNNDIEIFCKFKNSIKFLMIRRKHTLGYMEFIRGRYNIKNIDGIIFLFKQMTPVEIERISKSTFDELWNELWSGNKSKTYYYYEYTQSKKKFEKLKNNNDEDCDCYLGLDFYVDKIIPTWDYAEWGFPKGRRNYQEDDLSCAVREFEEESGFVKDDYKLLNKIEPINEQFIGTNGINYKHVYYTALSVTDKMPNIDPDNKSQADEIGDIGWFTYEEAINLIRSYHTERKRLLTEFYIYIMNNIIDMYHK
jgi:8-oxo-dGTP pyrophosphatase MutT (NUDIX family)